MRSFRSRLLVPTLLLVWTILGLAAWSTVYVLNRLQTSMQLQYGEALRIEASDLLVQIKGRTFQECELEVTSFQSRVGAYAWIGNLAENKSFHPKWVAQSYPGVIEADRQELLRWGVTNQATGARVESIGPSRLLFFAGQADSPITLVLCLPNWNEPLARARSTVWAAVLGLAGFALIGVLVISNWSSSPVRALARFASDTLDGRNVAGPHTEIRELAVLEAAVVQLERNQRQTTIMGTPDTESSLTNLPGAAVFRAALSERIDQRLPFAAALVDLSYFRSFNRRYGLRKGDEVLLKMATILQEVLREHSPDSHLLTHVGADRFLFLAAPANIELICSEFLRRFELEILTLYSPQERAEGAIKLRNRMGVVESFPMMQALVAVSTNLKRPIVHLAQVESILSEIRDHIKRQNQSSYMLDRRTGGDETLFTGETVEEAVVVEK
ncbi:MAG: hypothetical protein AMXMBFR33_04320 [Candidatus Xenobia bacterium]